MKQFCKVLAYGTCAWVACAVALSADTLVLRDGRRIRGALVQVRDETVEFDGVRGFFGRERIRVDQRDVLRIEFDDDRGRNDRDDRDDRDEHDRRDSNGGARQNERPAGMREREVRVDARTAWIDTGVTVRAGQLVYFVANGRVHWGPGRDDGPGGEDHSPRNEARPLPGRPAAGLIGRIGSSDDYFFIGTEQGAMRMREGGRLFLGVNDDYLQDNNGAFRVTVFY